MAKVKFPNRAKYKGVTYGADETFEIADKDVKAIQAAGGIVEEKPSRRKAADVNPEDNGSGKEEDELGGEQTPQE